MGEEKLVSTKFRFSQYFKTQSHKQKEFKMNIVIAHEKFKLDEKLASILVKKLRENELENKAVILNFRDKSYSAESGGFHPVEISIGDDGVIRYITDFSYVGLEFPELAIDLDWDFTSGKFQTLYTYDKVDEGLELFNIWQLNFIYYNQIGAYDEVEITI